MRTATWSRGRRSESSCWCPERRPGGAGARRAPSVRVAGSGLGFADPRPAVILRPRSGRVGPRRGGPRRGGPRREGRQVEEVRGDAQNPLSGFVVERAERVEHGYQRAGLGVVGPNHGFLGGDQAAARSRADERRRTVTDGTPSRRREGAGGSWTHRWRHPHRLRGGTRRRAGVRAKRRRRPRTGTRRRAREFRRTLQASSRPRRGDARGRACIDFAAPRNTTSAGHPVSSRVHPEPARRAPRPVSGIAALRRGHPTARWEERARRRRRGHLAGGDRSPTRLRVGLGRHRTHTCCKDH